RGRRRVAVARYAVEEVFPSAWDPDEEPDQWAAVARLLEEADPVTIGVNVSPGTALADGLTSSEMDGLGHALGSELLGRVVSAEALAVGWLETRIPGEVDALAEACGIAHGLLARALSREVVDPGRTSTDDVVWWLRERVRDLGLTSWFHPTVSVQRAGGVPRTTFWSTPVPVVVEPGDLVHVDFGIVHLGMHTDQQQHGYVLRPRESSAPDGLRTALAAANRVQDLLLAEMRPDRTGNDVLRDALAAAGVEGLRPRIYTHPIGLHGHAAGPTIGLWDRQDGVAGAGDLALHPDTAYSIELQAVSAVPGWGDVAVMLEEEAFLDAAGIRWLDGRQTDFHLI
ncbi:MAG TPA: M24 family metallopeptidase, partial [Acidimicrobiia bacterium]|nr:M24 family metallopeptidase [Acidimicrobiia bacterium]